MFIVESKTTSKKYVTLSKKVLVNNKKILKVYSKETLKDNFKYGFILSTNVNYIDFKNINSDIIKEIDYILDILKTQDKNLGDNITEYEKAKILYKIKSL